MDLPIDSSASMPQYADCDWSYKNISNIEKENMSVKPIRVALFKEVVEFLDKIKIDYFVDCGTLLAVWRNKGVMIKRDTDMDIGILEKDLHNTIYNLDLVPDGINVVTEFDGIEYKKSENSKTLFNGSRTRKMIKFRIDSVDALTKVTKQGAEVDIFTYSQIREKDGKYMLKMNYNPLYNPIYELFEFPWPFPLKRAVFEGIEVNVPHDTYKHLKTVYGYLGEDCYWDKQKCLYRKLGDTN